MFNFGHSIFLMYHMMGVFHLFIERCLERQNPVQEVLSFYFLDDAAGLKSRLFFENFVFIPVDGVDIFK